MKTVTSLLIGGLAAQQAAATFGSFGLGVSAWGDSNDCFSTPSNTDNECTESQAKGWTWDGIAVGAKIGASYSGFKVSGLTCSNKFGKRDALAKRTFGSKCALGSITKNISQSPKIECTGEKKNKGFSVGEFQVSTNKNTDIEFHYGMPDGSTCKHTASCSSSGTTVKNEQCGGATSVSWKLPDNSDNEDCEFGIHSIGWECGQNGQSNTASASTGYVASTGASFSFGFGASSTLISVPAVSTPEINTPSFVFPSGGFPSIATSVATPVVPGSEASTGYGVPSINTPGVPVITTPAVPLSSEVSGGASSSVEVPFSQNGTIPAGFTASTVYATSVYTVTSCAPEVTNCPARSGTPAVVTSVVAISTTICPVSETGAASVPAGSAPYGSSPSAPLSSGVSGEQSTPGAPFPSASTPGFPGGFPGASTPVYGGSSVVSSAVASSTSAAPSANCPGVLPKCLNSWIHKVGCSSNTDSDCYCKETDFTKKVIDCVSAWGATDSEVSEALSYLTGICAAYVPQNPGLVTNVPTSVTLGVPSSTPVASETPVASSGVSGEQSTPAVVSYSTSTVYATELHTITSCAPEVTNCPASSGTPAVVTSVVAISTTVCPVTATETPVASAPAGTPSAPASSGVEGSESSPAPSAPAQPATTSFSTSTIFSTAVSTSTTVNEQGSSSEVVVTQTVSVGTTICPVTATETPAESSPVASAPAGTPSAPASSGVEGSESSPAPSAPAQPQTTEVVSYSTSTVYSTAFTTSTATNEQGSTSEVVVTQTVSVGTTICPVTATQTVGTSVPAGSAPAGSAPASAPVSSGVEGGATSPAPTSAPAVPTYGTPSQAPVASSAVQGVTSAPSAQGSTPVTTISFVQTVTVPCTYTNGESAGATIPSSSTTSVVSTHITVPQVAFQTNTITVSGQPVVQTGLVQGTPASASATLTSAVATPTGAVEGGYQTFSSIVIPPTTPVGTPAGTPVATPPAYTGAASSLKSAGSMVGAGLVAAIFML